MSLLWVWFCGNEYRPKGYLSSCHLSLLKYLCKYLKLETKQKTRAQVQGLVRGGEREKDRGEDLRNARNRVKSRKGGTDAGWRHRERKDRKGFRGIQARKEEINRDHPPTPRLHSLLPLSQQLGVFGGRSEAFSLANHGCTRFFQAGYWLPTAPSEAREVPGAK